MTSLVDGLDAWFLDMRAANASPHTLAKYERVWRVFGAWLAERGITELEALDARQAKAFILQRLGEVAEQTAHNEVTPIKRFGAWCVESEWLTRHPFKSVKKPGFEKKEYDLIRPQEVAKLLRCLDRSRADEARDYCVVKLLVHAGLRREEVSTAKLAGFDKHEQSLIVTGKGNKQRKIWLGPELTMDINAYVARHRKRVAKSDFLFVSVRGGQIMGDSLADKFQEYVERAGITRHVTLHGLRHFAATAMLAQGQSLQVTADILGHANAIVTSKIYSHIDFASIAGQHARYDPLKLVS